MGDTLLPYNSSGGIINGGDYLPLAQMSDITPPASIMNLINMSYAQTYINWTWTDPTDADFVFVNVFIDNAFVTNVSKGMQFYNATGLAPDSEHTIATRTVDVSDNINLTWVNHTAKTAPTTTIPYDSNGNGRIDRNEAVVAVLDFFRGSITRQEAVDMVIAYFSM